MKTGFIWYNTLKEGDNLNNDKSIIKEIIEGKKDHYSVLMNKYHNELFKYIYNLTNNYQTTEDLLQEVFIKIYKNLTKYNEEKASFRTWIYRISSNNTLNYLKSKQRRNDYNTDLYEEGSASSNEDIYEDAIKNEQMNQILKAINKVLKPKHKQIMHLHFFSDLTVNEISESLDIPIKTIYKAVKSSIEKIKMEVSIDE